MDVSPDSTPPEGPHNKPPQTDSQHDDAELLRTQINRSFMFCPYFGFSQGPTLTLQSIPPLVEEAENLLNSLASFCQNRERELNSYISQVAPQIDATITHLTIEDATNLAEEIALASKNTQKRMIALGELARVDQEISDLLQPPEVFTQFLPPEASVYVVLSSGDAAAALAAQRAGLPDSLGRAAYAAELVLQIHEILIQRL